MTLLIKWFSRMSKILVSVHQWADAHLECQHGGGGVGRSEVQLSLGTWHIPGQAGIYETISPNNNNPQKPYYKLMWVTQTTNIRFYDFKYYVHFLLLSLHFRIGKLGNFTHRHIWDLVSEHILCYRSRGNSDNTLQSVWVWVLVQ